MNFWTSRFGTLAPAADAVDRDRLDEALAEAIADSRAHLKRRQSADGHWVFELEADATIPAEYIMLEHFLGDIDDAVEAKLAVYLRRLQAPHGGWSLFHGGDFNISASVKAYLALKLVGDDPQAPHMLRARTAILQHGGAAACNVFTRIALALFGILPWRAVPSMPAEIILLPRWFPFHLDKVSYWSRTVIVPLLILMALKPRAENPRGVRLDELFGVPAEQHENYLVNPTGSRWGDALIALDKLVKLGEPLMPLRLRRRAIEACLAWMRERLNGEDGLGGIYPAMANAVMAYRALGYPDDHPEMVTARQAIRKLLVMERDSGYCQPCMSPIWDTGLAALALMETGESTNNPALRRALDWLRERQVTEVIGDWAVQRPGLRPGGWAFQYRNDHYPDVDDTAVVAMALDRGGQAYRDSVERATEWVVGMQSTNGGWASFDAENTHYHLNHIPFADHGALLDPPTADVSARCLSMLAQLGYPADHPVMARGLDYLRQTQESDGSWFGRWGSNYVYGTWSSLNAMNAAGVDPQDPSVRKAVGWLLARQNADGGWGESAASYWHDRRAEAASSTASQTAWALLGLMAAGEVKHPAVRRGIEFLIDHPRHEGRWEEPWYTGTGFPRVFYLRYHGYSHYFPLWALARFRNLMSSNSSRVAVGM